MKKSDEDANLVLAAQVNHKLIYCKAYIRIALVVRGEAASSTISQNYSSLRSWIS